MTRVSILLLASLLFSCTNTPVTTQVAIAKPAIAASKPRPYYDEIYYRLKTHTVYPQESFAAGEQGVCKLKLMLHRDGSLVSAEITQSSGFARLDAACLQAARAPEFPPVPESVDAKFQEFFIEMPINFSLSP